MLEGLRELRNTLKFTSVITDAKKDTSKQADEERHRAGPRIKELLSLSCWGPGWVARGSILVSQAWKASDRKAGCTKGSTVLFPWVFVRLPCIVVID